MALGIVRVNTLFSAYPAYEATLESEKGRTVQLEIASYGHHQAKSRTVDVPPCSG